MEIQTFWFKKMHLKTLSGKWRPFCLGLNVLSTLSNIIPKDGTEATDACVPCDKMVINRETDITAYQNIFVEA